MALTGIHFPKTPRSREDGPAALNQWQGPLSRNPPSLERTDLTWNPRRCLRPVSRTSMRNSAPKRDLNASQSPNILVPY